MPAEPTCRTVGSRTRHTRSCKPQSRSRWSHVLKTLPSSWRDAQISEVCECSRSNPQGNGSFALPLLEIVDEERRLLDAIHIQPCLVTAHFNLHPGPFRRDQVDISLVLLGKFLAQEMPREARHRNVLH